MDELLPLIPFDMGGWFAYLPPSHPFVRDLPKAKEAAKAYKDFKPTDIRKLLVERA